MRMIRIASSLRVDCFFRAECKAAAIVANKSKTSCKLVAN